MYMYDLVILIRYNVYVYKDKFYFFSVMRFRWIQKVDGNMGFFYEWGIWEIYVGKVCSEYCNGYGSCRYLFCICDLGYLGLDCLYD